MHEQIARVLYYLQIHLLYASAVWLAAWIVTSIRSGSASTKYWIWVATSLNFILPVGALLDKVGASHLSWARPLGIIGDIGARISENVPLVAILSIAWLVGAILMLVRFWLRLRAEGRESAMSPPGALPEGIDRVLTAQELNAVLSHELTHATRRDNLICLVMSWCSAACGFTR